MNIIADTHILLWAATGSERLSSHTKSRLEHSTAKLFFSVASLWEVTIKSSLGRDDFNVDTRLLRRGLLDNGWHELSIESHHVIGLSALPALHKDPFDRIIISQAREEGYTLITADTLVSQYPGAIELV